jgi:hypothetical protein
MAAIASLMHANQKIEAIKLYRQMTGMGLKEAKDAVEAIERGEPVPLSVTTASFSPVTDPFRPGAGRIGVWIIALAVLLMLLGIGLAIALFANTGVG